MFGFGNRVRERQLKRAILIQNAMMLNMFSHQRKMLGVQETSSNKWDGVIASAINKSFGKDNDADGTTDEEKRVFAQVRQSIQSDPCLQKLILRVLYDIVSLCAQLKNGALLAEYPRALEVLERGRKQYPDVFEDWKELQFKALARDFADKYDPNLKGMLLKLF
jgi:hypothetical protein